ncbi:hypothetical protein ABT126_37875 [Streptomyces sp. NPDC002012]|uniref:hypothetical protein n=1 Tax=Streptomyces sp. NPDC002012 TaxID=3154532 RepID=UPI0033240BDF
MPPEVGSRRTTRGRVVVGVALVAVVALLATLLIVWWPESTRPDGRPKKDTAVGAAEDVTAAAVNLAASGLVVYEGRYTDPMLGRSRTRTQVTPGGTMLAETTVDGMTLKTMTVDGKTFVKADVSFWRRFGIPDKTGSTYGDNWVKTPSLGRSATNASLQQFAPDTIARELRREADKRLVRRGGLSTVGGVEVRRYTTPTRVVHITAEPPLRIVRMAPVAPRSGGGPSGPSADAPSGKPSWPSDMPSLPSGFPSLPSDLPSLPTAWPTGLPSLPPISPAGYHAGPGGGSADPVRAVGDDGGSYSVDLPPLTDTQRKSFQREVEKNVKELGNSIDLGVNFSVSGNVTLSPCSTSGCVANVTINNSITPGPDVRPAGDVSAEVTISVTLDGRPVGQCSQSVSMPPNGSARVSCPGNFYIPPSRNPRTHMVRAEAQAVARAMVQKEIKRVLSDVARDWKRNSPDYGVPGLSSPLKGSTDKPNKFTYRNPALGRANEPEPDAADIAAAQTVKNPASGTRDHMYKTWSKYLQRKATENKSPKSWTNWRKNYVENQGNPYKGEGFEGGFAQTNELNAEDGWLWGDFAQQLTSREMMNKITAVDRQPDIVNFDKKVLYELKFGSSPVKEDQVAKDAQLVKQGWRIIYIFSKRPRPGEREMLEKAGISWKVWKAVGTAVP